MIKHYSIVRQAARRAAGAANGTVVSLRNGHVEQEPQFTDRMLGRIEQAMSDFELNGVKWRAKTLTDRGPGAQEKRYGADFVGVLDINLPEFRVQKGFLAQAKLLRAGGYFAPNELERLRDQCRAMLELTPEAFVFLYSPQGISVVPAHSVVGTNSRHLRELYAHTIQGFYEEHFKSFIGDTRISIPDVSILEDILERTHARSALHLLATLGQSTRG